MPILDFTVGIRGGDDDLFSVPEVKALVMLRNGTTSSLSTDGFRVPETDLAKMLDYLETGMLNDRILVAKLGAAVARRIGHASRTVPVAASILSAMLPGAGTALGVALRELLADNT